MESNGWCRLHYKTNLSIGKRKGSIFVRGFAAKGLYAVLVGGGRSNTDTGRKRRLITPQEERHMVCCIG